MTCQCCQMPVLAQVLSEDIPAVLTADESFIATPDLIERLIDHNPSQWSAANHFGRDLTAQRMGRILARELSVRSTRDHLQRRGYCTSIFKGKA